MEPAGLHATRIVTNREMLVARAGRTGKHLEPVRLADLGPLDIVLPGPLNTRRQNIETYIGANGVDVRTRLELDAMMGTLEFVSNSDWVTVLPAILMANDLEAATRGRFVCGAIGGILLPIFVMSGLQYAGGAVLVVCLVGELLERYLFFTAVIPPKMPGGIAS